MRTIRPYLFFFLIYGFIGWLLEVAWLALIGQRQIHGLVYPLPFKPSYGFGALIIILLQHYLSRLPTAVRWLVFGLVLAAWEICTGVISFAVYRRQLWQYNGGFLNILGYTDAAHVALWGILGLGIIYVIQPLLDRLMSRSVSRTRTDTEYQEFPPY